MLFLADAVHENDEIIKWTRRYLLGHRRILKKGRLYHTLRKSIFSKGKRRPENAIFSSRRHLCKAGRLLLRCYSIFSIVSTMFIFAIECSGIAVASRQAATETTAASIIAITGTATSCKASVFAAPTKIQQT